MIVLRSTWLFPLLCAPAFSQFLFVTGSQTPKSTASFGSSLFEFGVDGAIHKIEEIASERAGTSFAEISYDARKMVVLTRNPNSAVVVVDLEKGRVSKRCRQPRVSSVEEWLAEIPSRGLSMIWYSLAQDIDHGIITAMTLDEATPCQKSITNPSPYDSASVVSSGQAGVADIAVNEQFATGMDSDGHIRMRLSGQWVELGFQVPFSFRAHVEKPLASVLVSNAKLLVVLIDSYGQENARRLLCLRKSDNTWHTLATPVGPSVLRAFGSVIAMPQTQAKTNANSESVGRAEWRNEASSFGPNITGVFRRAPVVYPGELQLYDIESGRTYAIRTGQADSEVLLVENDIVYYRVSDHLYSAQISESAIGEAKLLVADEVIRDAHWAFLKH